MSKVRAVTLLGVSGRMGQMLVRTLAEFPDLALVGATAAPGSRWVGCDAAQVDGGAGASGIAITADPGEALRGAAVAIEFALPQATAANLAACLSHRCPLVIGTTGHSAEVRQAIDAAAAQLPILMAPNMSLGVNVLLKLAALAAKALDDEYDAEVFEAHHRHKKDAPSGTALAIGAAVAAARGTTLQQSAVYAREGQTGPRARGTVGFSVMRAGDIVGEHVLTFAGGGERLEIAHRAHDRASFARGALKAAQWLAGRPPGLYGMQDVLGLTE